MDLPPTLPEPTTTKVPTNPALASDRKASAQSIRDVIFRRTQPRFTDLHPRISPTPRMVTPPPRVETPPPRVVPIDVQDNEPIAHCTRYRISALYESIRAFPSEFILRWAASEVLHSNQWEPLALAVIDTKTGQTLEHRALRRHPRLGATWNTSYGDELGQICQ